MSQTSQQHKGLSLLELLLVLAIIAVLVFLGINRYQLYKREKDILAVKQNVDLLFQATYTYYYVFCRANQPFTVSISDLSKIGFDPTKNLISNNIIPPLNYQVGATQIGTTQQTQKPIYQLSVTGTPKTSLPMPLYQQLLNATGTSGSQFIWIRLPSYIVQTTESGLWISEEALRQYKETASQQQGDDTCAY